MTEKPPYLLRYHANGQIMLNDPRLVQALNDALTEARMVLDHEIINRKPMYGVGLFYEESEITDGLAGANVIGTGRTPARAIRNALGWHFGSADLAHIAWIQRRTMDATHDDRLVIR